VSNIEEQVIYLDILLIVNMIINFMLIKLSEKFSGYLVKKRRIFLGAILGTLYSLIIFAPNINTFLLFLLKLVFAMSIIAVTFGLRDVKKYFRCVVLFFVSNILFAGAVIAFFIIFKPKGMYINNSVIYFNFSAISLILISVLVYCTVSLVYYFVGKRTEYATRYNILVEYKGKSTVINGLVDTGCDLTEIFSRTPVCVCEFDSIKTILPKLMSNIISSDMSDMNKISGTSFGKEMRLIPYHDVSGSGMMCAVKPDKFVVIDGKNQTNIENVYVAVTKKNLSNGDYNCLINPQIFN